MAHESDIAALIPGFLEEVADRLDDLERDLAAIPGADDPRARLTRVVATLHTIKGSASCLSLFSLAEVVHRAEEIIAPWHAEKGAPDRAAIRSLHDAVASVRAVSESLALGAAPSRDPDEIARAVPLRDVLEHHASLARARARERARDVVIEVRFDADTTLDPEFTRVLCPALLHTLNNCIDHAAQPPDVRAAAGKNPATAITLSAQVRPDGTLLITIADDGPGLDRAAIARRADALGCTSTPDSEHIDDETLQRLVFHPGLSTTESPSIRAGRGVGLEGVRLAVSDLGGSVRVLSLPGRGTTLTFLIPVLNRSSGFTDTGSESADAA